MSLGKEVVSANTISCPDGRKGMLTVLVFKDGSIEYKCSAERRGIGEGDDDVKRCTVTQNGRRVTNWCRDYIPKYYDESG